MKDGLGGGQRIAGYLRDERKKYCRRSRGRNSVGWWWGEVGKWVVRSWKAPKMVL